MIGQHRQEHMIRSSVGDSLLSKEGGEGDAETVADPVRVWSTCSLPSCAYF